MGQFKKYSKIVIPPFVLHQISLKINFDLALDGDSGDQNESVGWVYLLNSVSVIIFLIVFILR